MNNMTALVSCFARAYHRWANVVPVFDDTAAEALLGEDFRQIAQNMQQGAAFFCPASPAHRRKRSAVSWTGSWPHPCLRAAHSARGHWRVKQRRTAGSM